VRNLRRISLVSAQKRMKWRVVTWIWVAFLGISGAQAGISFGLKIYGEVKPAYSSQYATTWYYALPSLSDADLPVSYHRVESPTGYYSANFGTNSGANSFIFSSPAILLDSLTNGNWRLWLNRETTQEVFYTFTINAAWFESNALVLPSIVAPADGMINVPSNTVFNWSGPSEWDQIAVQSYHDDQLDYVQEFLGGDQVDWTNGPILQPGTNFFSVTYRIDLTSLVDISTPTNYWEGALTNWTVNSVTVDSKRASGFLVAGLPPSDLALALDAPGMIWQSWGDNPWLGQATNAHDWTDAAQSGATADNGLSGIRTVVYGSNEISFWWKSDCEGFADYVQFSHNYAYVDDLTGNTGWKHFTYPLAANQVHVLEWTYYKDESIAEGADAAFLDQVRLATSPGAEPQGQPLNLTLRLVREEKHAFDESASNQVWLYAVPELTGAINPISYHRVESPSNELFDPICSADFGLTNTGSYHEHCLAPATLLDRLTNGSWKVWLNRETSEEEYYEFAIASLGLATNDFADVTILSPTNGGELMELSPAYAWTGPNDWDGLHVEAYHFVSRQLYAEQALPAEEESWGTGPMLDPGTNVFEVRYQRNATNALVLTSPFHAWTFNGIQLETEASSGFVVTIPMEPPRLTMALTSTNTIALSWPVDATGFELYSNTNLATADWIPTGVMPTPDGTNLTVIIDPMELECYFRLAKP